MNDNPEYFYRIIGSRIAEIKIERLTPQYVFCKRSEDTGYASRFDRDKVEFDKLQAIRVAIQEKHNFAEECIKRAERLNQQADILTATLSAILSTTIKGPEAGEK